jgi:methylated-DNA-[protein]-cysteine S-methyltransferase
MIQNTVKNDATITDFRKKVYLALLTVPAGNVVTYALLGRMINCRCAQAIGQALKYNPYAPDVPCHRVIKSDLTIGGFHGASSGTHIQHKLKLLAEEGVFFDEDMRLENPDKVLLK